MELQSVNDIASGKEALQGFLSAREINRLRNFDQVKKALTRKQASEQLALEEQLMQEQIAHTIFGCRSTLRHLFSVPRQN